MPFVGVRMAPPPFEATEITERRVKKYAANKTAAIKMSSGNARLCCVNDTTKAIALRISSNGYDFVTKPHEATEPRVILIRLD